MAGSVYAFTGKGLRKVPIEYFDVNQEEAARSGWISLKKPSQKKEIDMNNIADKLGHSNCGARLQLTFLFPKK